MNPKCSIVGAALAAAIGSQFCIAQSAPTLTPSYDHSTGVGKVSWYREQGTAYFLQVSVDAQNWQYCPAIEWGSGAQVDWEICETSGSSVFARVVLEPYSSNPETEDFDGDGILNLPEIATYFTDPFNSDTDGDGLPDNWEIANGLNPTDNGSINLINGAVGDSDQDGLTNLEEYWYSTNPTNPDTDGDGATDGSEIVQNNDPNDATDTPQVEWFEVTGDLDKNVVKRRSRTLTIPPGEKRLVIVAVASAEYPTWTGGELDENGFPYVFNDLLSWDVQPSEGDPLVDEVDVNTRHSAWAEEEAREFTLNGLLVNIEETQVLEAGPYTAITVDIELTATNIGDGTLPSTIMVGFVPFDAIPDVDRDGSITNGDKGKVTEETPWYWWVNENDSDAPEPHFGDVPGQNVDNADQGINGIRDLVDYFPVKLDLKPLLGLFPLEDHEYRIHHPTGAINFVEMEGLVPSSSREGNGAGSYLLDESIGADALIAPHKSTGGEEGAALSDAFLQACLNDEGVLLLEGTTDSTDALEILIYTKEGGGGGGAKKQRAKAKALRLMIEQCESLMWSVNIRGAVQGNNQFAVTVPAPQHPYWTTSRKDRWFVFCHGYSVGVDAARGWNTEVFKRLHHFGSDARFLAVSWEGNQGQITAPLPFLEGKTPDYWINVDNAVLSSLVLANAVNSLSGGDANKIVIAGHSLGNMLVSSAICDYGAQGLKAGQYFLLNAAVPRGAYSGEHTYSVATQSGDYSIMRHPDWNDYEGRLWSANHWNLYNQTDARYQLRWRDRFATLGNLTSPHNYFSSSEDVLMNSSGGLPGLLSDVIFQGQRAWVKQEMGKGLATQAAVQFGGNGAWVSRGGWKVNSAYSGLTTQEANALDNSAIQTQPFFEPFATTVIDATGGAKYDVNGVSIHGAQGSQHCAIPAVRSWLLANEVPALSSSAGANQVGNLGGAIPDTNTDMDTAFKNFGFGDWKHSDLKNRSIDQVWGLFDNLATKGDLK